MPKQQEQNRVKERIRIKEPDMYDVQMLNDDFTTMEFVVKVLKLVFYHTASEAERLMLDIHHKGMCTVGVYTLDVARSKVDKATRMAREEGFPLRLDIKPHQ